MSSLRNEICSWIRKTETRCTWAVFKPSSRCSAHGEWSASPWITFDTHNYKCERLLNADRRMVRVEGRGMSNRTLLWRSVVAYPIVIRDFIANTHIHTYAHTFDKWHNVSFSWQILSRRTHQSELGFHWCLCQISHSKFLSSSLWCFEWAWAIFILYVRGDDSKRFRHRFSNGERYLIVCSFFWSSTEVYWEKNKGSISGGSLPNHIE